MSGPLDSPQFWNRQCDAVSPLGEVKSTSASGAGIDRSSPIAQRILSKLRAAYGDNGKLPENGIRQDKSISTRSQLAGMLRLLKLTARGLGISQHQPVVAFEAMGDVLRVQAVPASFLQLLDCPQELITARLYRRRKPRSAERSLSLPKRMVIA